MTKAKSDSLVHHEERLAKLQGESRLQAGIDAVLEEERREQQAVRDRATDKAEEKFLNDQAALLPAGTTRDQLLDKIRQMREEKLPEHRPIGYTPEGLERLHAEQEAGRAAVARAQAQIDMARAAREKAAVEQRAREGHMETVHHPNPGQDEQFPASKATLGKRK